MTESTVVPPCPLSIVIPVKDDAHALAHLLSQLSKLPTAVAGRLEIVVADGGSSDGSAALAEKMGAQVLSTSSGRGVQLNAGCQAARGTMIWMLHADSRPSDAALRWLVDQPGQIWGRFDVAFDQPGWTLRLLAMMMNARSRLTGICTGDQGIFVHRHLIRAVGGIPEQPLMEDVELSRRLNALCKPYCASHTVTTSARRWRRNGFLGTVLSMWWFRIRYWLGADPEVLASQYYGR